MIYKQIADTCGMMFLLKYRHHVDMLAKCIEEEAIVRIIPNGYGRDNEQITSIEGIVCDIGVVDVPTPDIVIAVEETDSKGVKTLKRVLVNIGHIWYIRKRNPNAIEDQFLWRDVRHIHEDYHNNRFVSPFHASA